LTKRKCSTVEEFLLPRVAAKISTCDGKFFLTWHVNEGKRGNGKNIYLNKMVFLFGFCSLIRNLSLLCSLEDRLHLGKTQIKFGFSLGLHYL